MHAADWQMIKDVFHQATRLDSGRRQVFLNAVCADDANLRTEVESLLASFREGNAFLEKPAYRNDRSFSAWQLEKGQEVSHYKIVEPIGSGGMGEVYLARDQKLGRDVALKLLPAFMSRDTKPMRRFRLEAAIVSSLDHPNIVKVHQFEEVNGLEILVTEFVKGVTLRERMRRGIPVPEAVGVGRQIAEALTAAHQAGIVHRDIKPENIMIRHDGCVKVLDFGSAKPCEHSPLSPTTSSARKLSLPGMVLGTVSYMSPEQARAQDLDGRSDIFSLGVVIYEMLAGRPPFTGETLTDVIASVIKTEPPNVSYLNSNVPPDLDRIVSWCMKKERVVRFQTAAEVVAELKRTLSH
jgi:serine/threonine protein kinase